jgi:hypothetical protein
MGGGGGLRAMGETGRDVWVRDVKVRGVCVKREWVTDLWVKNACVRVVVRG